MDRLYSNAADIGKQVLVSGWMFQKRDLGGVKFFLLRDRAGKIQVTLKKGNVSDALLQQFEGLGREDCVSVTGTVSASKQAPGGREIIPEEIKVIARAESPLPFETKEQIVSGLDIRFDYRFLDLRSPKVQALFTLKDAVLAGVRDYFSSSGFVEIHTPVIQAAGAEGGATLFPLIYYNKEAFLRQSPQLYKQIMMASGLDRIWEIGPAFRAEKFHTRRHVSEFLSIDTEIAWIESEEDVLKVAEGLVVHAIKHAAKQARAALDELGAKLAIPELPFKRLEYDQALSILAKNGIDLEWGSDMEDAQEKVLGQEMLKHGHEWYFITKYPTKVKPFYIMSDGKYSRGIDLANRGMEIASGGQREHRHDVLTKAFLAKGLDPAKFKFYIDAFRYGMPPHGGFAIGAERLVQQIAGVENIKECILFPRTPERLVP
ncbi:MAG: aspartate--tRNA(Asn) ligase [Candidatus Aenigmarchaeota archaeon]|nr:aspartate--tRNA(Asn) ligase [Candidatus Aenigmarchaeota archaeon]